MNGLLLLLITGLMLSYILSKDPEEVFPPYIMSFMLGLYALGILKKSHHAFTASLFFFLLIAVAFSVVLIIRVRPFMQSGRHSAAEIRGFFGRACLKAAGHPGFVFFLTVCVVMCICFSTHFVNVWDDFHYNATFPKDCYYYGTMPVGSELATHYKSYLPLLQLFFYWGFQGSTFSEPMMFQYKIVLIYVLILPLFKRMNDTGGIRRVITGLSALILPFLFLFEILESLSMDTVMGLLFAYAALKITVRRKDDLFGYYEIIVSLLCLTLIKSIAFYFTGVCLALWLCDLLVSEKARDRRELALFGSCVILNAGAFLSWRIFCERNGNTTYLSNRLFSNIKEGSLAIPEYGGQTLSGILKSIFSMPTNLSRFGLSLAGITVIALLTAVWFYMKKVLTRRIMTGIFVCGLGLLGYILILSYTYIFIFDPWEAESLSSLDRYFGTYSLMTGYVLLFMLTLPALDRKADKFVIFGVPVLLALTLPWQFLPDVLIPDRYLSLRAEEYATRQEVARELAAFHEAGYPKGNMVVVYKADDPMYERSMDYEFIPNIVTSFSSGDYELSERPGVLRETIEGQNTDYIYFSGHEQSYEDISIYDIPSDFVSVPEINGLYIRSGT